MQSKLSIFVFWSTHNSSENISLLNSWHFTTGMLFLTRCSTPYTRGFQSLWRVPRHLNCYSSVETGCRKTRTHIIHKMRELVMINCGFKNNKHPIHYARTTQLCKFTNLSRTSSCVRHTHTQVKNTPYCCSTNRYIRLLFGCGATCTHSYTCNCTNTHKI